MTIKFFKNWILSIDDILERERKREKNNVFRRLVRKSLRQSVPRVELIIGRPSFG